MNFFPDIVSTFCGHFMSKYTLLFCSHPIFLSPLYQKRAVEVPDTSSSDESDQSIDLENDSTEQEEEETASDTSDNDSGSGEELEEEYADQEEEEDTAGECSQEEDAAEESDEEQETVDTTDKTRFTAKGTERVRSVKWNENEKFALFFNINRLQATLKGRGRENKKSRDAAWEEVKGKKIPVSCDISC